MQTLKIIRYAAKLALATTASDPSTKVVRDGLSSLESSLGTSRKAYRLGKFLQNVNAVRKVHYPAPFSSLEIIANVGDGVYYFVEQFQWLVKAGVLPIKLGPRLTKISAGGELLGYVASITLTLLRLHNLLEREVALLAELKRRRRARAVAGEKLEANDGKDDILIAEIRQLRTRRLLRTLGLAQDIADAFLAVSDLRGAASATSHSFLSSKSLLAIAGLVSGCISAYKNWPGVA